MPNVFDYLEWRGDLSFAQSPVNEVDSLIFCLLSYVDLDGIVPADPKKGRITVRAAAAEYFFTHDTTPTRPLGLIVPADTLTLFRRMAKYPRFRDLELTGYVNEVSEERGMQFSALTVRLPGEQLFVAFRGTDDTIVGWREDFNLSHMEEVPSQRMAAEYLNRLDMTPDTALFVGGHSKGGNLAVWGAVHAEEVVRRHMAAVYSHDGPGFSEGTVQSDAYRALSDRIHILLPDDSLVGLLLEHDEEYAIVKSNRKGLFQHDGLSWEVLGGRFLRADTLSPRGIHTDTVIRDHIQGMTKEERRDLIEIIFNLLESTGAKTLTELHANPGKTVFSMIKAYRELPSESQKAASFLWDKLVSHKVTGVSYSSKKTAVEHPPKPKQGKGRTRISFFPLLLP